MITRILASSFALMMVFSMPAMAANAAAQAPDGSWITLSGEVAEAEAPDSFVLDYGGGTVRVELDNWSPTQYPPDLRQGDKVKVRGRVDNDTYDSAKIEAKSVYVENLGIEFYGSSGDEEAMTSVDLSPHDPIKTGEFSISGHVESIDGPVFTIDTGERELTVDTSTLEFDPLDRPGLRNLTLKTGDYVTVTGKARSSLFELRKIVADSIIIRATSPLGEDRIGGDTPIDPGAPVTLPKPVL
ncbi:MAG: NirD/YgiW/YdeI family stress tolerance protein [Pseudomonadota bacterium]|nr:NirD/YgiW/YdeI family stress tolerance protein [Pseudomonadota bacterium]